MKTDNKPDTKLEPKSRAFSIITKADSWLNFAKTGKVLDLGCGGGDVTRLLAACFSGQIVGVDIGAANENEDNWQTIKMNANELEFEDDSFDVVISNATLEHFYDMPKVLSEIKRILKIGGKAYMTGGPIWTSWCGNHYNHHLVYDPVFSVLPKWCHLYMERDELLDYLLAKNVDAAIANRAVRFIYDESYINRMPRTDILDCLIKSGLHIHKLTEIYSHKFIESKGEVKERLLKTKYLPVDFDIGEIVVELEK